MISKNIIFLSALRKILTCMPPYWILKFIINREISTYHCKESPSQLPKLVRYHYMFRNPYNGFIEYSNLYFDEVTLHFDVREYYLVKITILKTKNLNVM